MIADFSALELHLTRVLPEYYRHSSWWNLTPLEQERDVRDATRWNMEFGSKLKATPLEKIQTMSPIRVKITSFPGCPKLNSFKKSK